MEIYRCEKCGKEAKTLGGLNVHKSTMHKESKSQIPAQTSQEKIRCSECGREFKNEHGLKIHSGNAHIKPKADREARPEIKLKEEIVKILEMPLLDDEYRLALIEYVVRR